MPNRCFGCKECRSAVEALRKYKSQYVGLYEFAQICRVKKPTFGGWRIRKFAPPPDVELAMGPIWFRETVSRWLWGMINKGGRYGKG